MKRPPKAPIDELQGFLGLLEHNRLELVEKIIANSDKGYTDKDMERLALHGNAIRSVKDAIDFRVNFDAGIYLYAPKSIQRKPKTST